MCHFERLFLLPLFFVRAGKHFFCVCGSPSKKKSKKSLFFLLFFFSFCLSFLFFSLFCDLKKIIFFFFFVVTFFFVFCVCVFFVSLSTKPDLQKYLCARAKKSKLFSSGFAQKARERSALKKNRGVKDVT